MGETGHVFLALTTGIIGLAALAVVLSNQANTSNVVNTTFSGLTSLITAALKPVGG